MIDPRLSQIIEAITEIRRTTHVTVHEFAHGPLRVYGVPEFVLDKVVSLARSMEKEQGELTDGDLRSIWEGVQESVEDEAQWPIAFARAVQSARSAILKESA